ncbi:MAG: helix-turn-helix transcriptional regulator [Dehalococcoidales bacterium]|nr:helix-turn-helix transcriptional regulator [Dehalococcoidales bacterium]
MIKVKINKVVVEKEIARRNLSLNMLAIKAGISSGYISQLVSGDRYPSPQLREKLQKALQPLTFDDIFILEEIDESNSQGGVTEDETGVRKPDSQGK